MGSRFCDGNNFDSRWVTAMGDGLGDGNGQLQQKMGYDDDSNSGDASKSSKTALVIRCNRQH